MLVEKQDIPLQTIPESVQGLNVLIVDDEEYNRKLIKNILRQMAT